jgi:hypothetical protein
VTRRRRRWPIEPNIRRYEHNGSHEWVVAFTRTGIRYVKYFPDGTEGPDASRARAIRYRDWLRPRLPPLIRLHRRSAANTSGIIGVTRIIDRTRAGNLIPRWVGFWYTPAGRQAKRSFSVPKFGEAQAKQLAIKARRRGEDELRAARTLG